jgi:DNA topoisomerase III
MERRTKVTDTLISAMSLTLIAVLIFQCRNVVWLPGSLSEAAVTNQVCPICAPGHPRVPFVDPDLCWLLFSFPIAIPLKLYGNSTTPTGPVYKIQFKFRRRDIPPNFDVDHLGKLY